MPGRRLNTAHVNLPQHEQSIQSRLVQQAMRSHARQVGEVVTPWFADRTTVQVKPRAVVRIRSQVPDYIEGEGQVILATLTFQIKDWSSLKRIENGQVIELTHIDIRGVLFAVEAIGVPVNGFINVECKRRDSRFTNAGSLDPL